MTSQTTSTNHQQLDQAFAQRLHNSILTVQAWDDDPSFLWECRAMLPWDELANETGKYAAVPQDALRYNNANIRFVQRLARFFQRDFMTWVNQPSTCTVCCQTRTSSSSSDDGCLLRYQRSRGPETLEENQGGASRVEVYYCETCQKETTTFPRYNVPRKLLETRQGRCGEYANLFGCLCRAVGFDTRYISDFTDHVWTEVRVVHEGREEWIMVDSCEGVVNEPSMYEAGWGKKLSYILAIHATHCMDVTWRYTRQGHLPDFMERRRKHASSEVASESIVKQCCQRLMAGLKSKEREEWQKRLAREAKILFRYQQQREWKNEYDKGRMSGSLQWKLDRKEAGKFDSSGEKAKDEGDARVVSYSIETFMPMTSDDITIAVHPYPSNPRKAIVVSWTACGVGQADALSVVVIDDQCLGCILQSKSFHSMEDFVSFVESVPENRCFAIVGKLPRDKVKTQASKTLPDLLPAFKLSAVEEGILFIGQKCALPDWAFCSSFEESPEGHQILIGGRDVPSRDLSLRTLRNVQPASVLGRLPGDWSTASEAEKRQGFLSFKDFQCSGYCTKPGLPVYLLGETAFPLEKRKDGEDEDDSSCWNTFLWWPTPMVPESDHGIVETSNVDSTLLVKVPLDLDFFQGLLGSALQTKSGTKPTGKVLENTRLVGLYFSAHWCPPCKSFTPLLAEMYEALKDDHPSRGLEMVFVSSDRDSHSFDRYYSSMPWTAIPFENLGFLKANLSMRYGVKGIPFLVILDAVSGQIVVPGTSSRQEVMRACQRGDIAIEDMFNDWVDRLPAETKEIMSMLEVSCMEDRIEPSSASGEGESSRYLDHAQKANSDLPPFERVPSSSSEDWEIECRNRVLRYGANGKADIRQVLQTALKYLENARKEPWTAKFRSFRLSNKVVDRITSIPHGVTFLESVGLQVLPSQTDYVVTISLALNLDELREDLEAYLEEYST